MDFSRLETNLHSSCDILQMIRRKASNYDKMFEKYGNKMVFDSYFRQCVYCVTASCGLVTLSCYYTKLWIVSFSSKQGRDRLRVRSRM